MILFSSQFISQARSINHGFLGFLFSILGSLEHGVNLSLESVDASLQTALAGHVTGIDGLDLIHSSASITNFSFNLTLGPVSRVDESSALLSLTRERGSLALRNTNGFLDLCAGASLVLEGLDGVTKLSLVALE